MKKYELVYFVVFFINVSTFKEKIKLNEKERKWEETEEDKTKWQNTDKRNTQIQSGKILVGNMNLFTSVGACNKTQYTDKRHKEQNQMETTLITFCRGRKRRRRCLKESCASKATLETEVQSKRH